MERPIELVNDDDSLEGGFCENGEYQGCRDETSAYQGRHVSPIVLVVAKWDYLL